MAENEKKEAEVLGKCPVCDGGIIEKKSSFGCNKAKWSNEGTEDAPKWKNEGCGYSIFKSALGKFGGDEITPDEVKSLLKDGSFKKELKSTKAIEVDEKFGVKINFSS
ncbi:hypothetical protein [Arcobacter sp. 15-2]|uniref:hypothetical protein n=1 Tax=Arcobacter sp. 15-2 TaxID=3374109 RepID=UPI00399D567E